MMVLDYGLLPDPSRYGWFKYYFRLGYDIDQVGTQVDIDDEMQVSPSKLSLYREMTAFCEKNFGAGINLEKVDDMTQEELMPYRWCFLFESFFYFRHDSDTMRFKLAFGARNDTAILIRGSK